MPAAALTLLLVVTAATAQPLEVREGVEFFEQMRSEEALERFQAALEREDLTDDARADALVWLGRSLVDVGDETSASAAFADACRASLPVCSAAEVSSPRALALLERARKKQAAAEAEPPDPGPPAEPAPAPDDGGGALQTVALVASGGLVVASLAAIGGGLGFGVLAADRGAQAQAHEDADSARALRTEAETSQLAANALFVIGGALLFGGAASAIVGLLPGE